MAAKRVLIDSSIIIEFFRKRKRSTTWLYRLLNQNSALYISVITHYELLCGARTPDLQQDTLKLLQLFSTIDLSEHESQKAATIYQELKKANALIGTSDILIAATAMENELPIATHNQSHFRRISTLQLITQ